MLKYGTKGRNFWALLEEVYRKQLATIEITQLADLGIMSPTNYYQIRRGQMLPRYDVACYLGLCFFAVFLERDPDPDTPTQARYRSWKSWDIVLEITQAFALDFTKRCGNDEYPIDPAVRISKNFQQDTPESLAKTLIKHDRVGSTKPGILLQHAVAHSIKFGG